MLLFSMYFSTCFTLYRYLTSYGTFKSISYPRSQQVLNIANSLRKGLLTLSAQCPKPAVLS
jgi:hypothetical protein